MLNIHKINYNKKKKIFASLKVFSLLILILIAGFGCAKFSFLKSNVQLFMNVRDIYKKIFNFMFNFDIDHMEFAVIDQSPLLKILSNHPIIKLSKNEEFEKEKVVQKNLKNMFIEDVSQRKLLGENSFSSVALKNQTNIKISADQLLTSEFFSDWNSEFKVLILHTHTTERYNFDENLYDPNESSHGVDFENGVVAVGKEIELFLNDKGVNAVHDATYHEQIKHKEGSYGASLETFFRRKNEDEKINFMLDIHRDSVHHHEKKVKFVIENEGEKYSQCMFVVGTNDGGLEHDGWMNNLIIAAKIQSLIEKKLPGLMRPINVRKERFNQHACLHSLMIEVGTSGNTLLESKRSARVIAECFSEFLTDLANKNKPSE